MSIFLTLLIVVHVIVCVLMVLLVLMQRPRSEGLGAAFGGGMTENVFGAQTTNVLAKFTTWLAGAFFAITLLLSIITARTSGGTTGIQKELMNSPLPAAAASPAPSAETLPTTSESTPAAATEPSPAQ